ncbi:putative Ig domain-containing protein [Streptomyces cocklensis]|uniref:Serine protease n=1 Tax=Actinacidiphila cocklensis TaxID=887465 RepID=A0A9W4DNW0_9ACTN|nr:putative Ig domain-containing protein [Actinacidiphila cocklensis]MDD1058000.1 putative Ig domain-containing protein [Actinacidiphila cocklensis]CAG6393018.1 Serine protease [Actinacidiphila cocklensis]
MVKTFHRGAARAAFTGLASLALVTGAAFAAAPLAAAAPTPAPGQSVANPYSPAHDHAYRHGVVPTLQQNAKMKSWAAAQASPAATGPETLSYGGGIDGIGVQSGHSKVYLVFYGTQWGTQSTNSSGDLTFSGDAKGAAPVAQEMFKGIGTGSELWSADLTQWCDGPNVSAGATSCPSNASFVPYQSGGVLSGVWYDNAAASPSAATGHQLGVEAVKAASHFGNTTAAANRDAYYVILSPHGTNPDSYQGQYCAWHDYNGDTTLTGGAVSSTVGDVAFSNQPYNMDSGAGCGVGFVNSPGALDGWTMTLGHEWHEMMSDQNPAGGWTNHTGSSYDGQENSDECAWLNPGTTGGAANITMGTGTFAEQASWSNDTNSCAISHPIVGGGNTVTVTSPGNQSSTVGTAVSLQISASDSASGQTLTYSATGLPAGLGISSSGLITGTPTTSGTSTSTVTAKDTTGASGSTSFTWTVSTTGGGCASPGQKIGNPGFETGTAAPWTASSGVIDNSSGEAAHTGSWKAWMNGYGTTHTDTVSQSVTIPAGCAATFSFYLHIDTAESGSTAYDKLTVQVGSTTLATYSNANAATGYTLKSFSLSSYAGQTVTLKFTGTEDSTLQTSFVIDDTALNAS